jgi:putative transposase
MPRRVVERPSGDVSYALYFMLTISTKRREPYIDAQVGGYLRQHWIHKCKELGIHLLALGVLSDHVHFLLSLRPTHYIPDVVHDLKGSASHAVNHAEDLNATLYWSEGYDVRTVGERSLEVAREYILAQHQRHPDRIPK